MSILSNILSLPFKSRSDLETIEASTTHGATSGSGSDDHWINRFFNIRPLLKNQLIGADAARQIMAFHHGVRLASEAIGKTPRHIVEKKKGSRVTISDHPSEKLLSVQANPLTTSSRLFETMHNHSIIHGNGYAELVIDKEGNGIEAWLLTPWAVTPQLYRDSNGKIDLYYEIAVDDSKPKILPKERVLHIAGFGFDGIKGYPALEVMSRVLSFTTTVEDFGSLFFSQGINSGGYVTVPAGMKKDAVKNLKKDLSVLNEGIGEAHRFKFLYDNVTFQPSTNKPEESQFLGTRGFQIIEIARGLGIPPAKLYEYSKGVSWASLEALQTEFVVDRVSVDVIRWEEELTRKIFNKPQDKNLRVKFNLNSLMRGDSAARSNYMRTMVMSGIMTRNEARALEDLPPVDGGDEIMVPGNMMEISDKEQDGKDRIQD